MNNYFNTILSYFFILGLLNSCRPPITCTEPKCTYSDVYANIEPILSGNLDSIVHIGDTLKFSLNLPDTIKSNYGDLVFGYLIQGSYFTISCYGYDSFTKDGPISSCFAQRIILNGSTTHETAGFQSWDMNSRKFECLFIPTQVGKYSIGCFPVRIGMKALDGKEWLVMPSHNFNSNIDRHVAMYASWWPIDMQTDKYNQALADQTGYYFEVR